MVRMLELNDRQRTVKRIGIELVRAATVLPVPELPRSILQELLVEAILWGAELIEYDGLRPEFRSRPVGAGARVGFQWLWGYRLYHFLARWRRSAALQRRLSPEQSDQLVRLAEHLLHLERLRGSSDLAGWEGVRRELSALGEEAAVGAALAYCYAALEADDDPYPAPSEALQRPHPFISASVWDDFRAWNRSADYVLTERFDLQVFGHAPEHPTV